MKIISDFLYVCQSVHCLTSLLKLGYLLISPVEVELSFSNFGTHSWNVSALVQNNLGFLVGLSVCSLPHFLTDIMSTVDSSSSGWATFLKFSEYISRMFVNWFKYFQIFCMSVSMFIASLPHWYYVNSGYLQFWMS